MGSSPTSNSPSSGHQPTGAEPSLQDFRLPALSGAAKNETTFLSIRQNVLRLLGVQVARSFIPGPLQDLGLKFADIHKIFRGETAASLALVTAIARAYPKAPVPSLLTLLSIDEFRTLRALQGLARASRICSGITLDNLFSPASDSLGTNFEKIKNLLPEAFAALPPLSNNIKEKRSVMFERLDQAVRMPIPGLVLGVCDLLAMFSEPEARVIRDSLYPKGRYPIDPKIGIKIGRREETINKELEKVPSIKATVSELRLKAAQKIIPQLPAPIVVATHVNNETPPKEPASPALPQAQPVVTAVPPAAAKPIVEASKSAAAGEPKAQKINQSAPAITPPEILTYQVPIRMFQSTLKHFGISPQESGLIETLLLPSGMFSCVKFEAALRLTRQEVDPHQLVLLINPNRRTEFIEQVRKMSRPFEVAIASGILRELKERLSPSIDKILLKYKTVKPNGTSPAPARVANIVTRRGLTAISSLGENKLEINLGYIVEILHQVSGQDSTGLKSRHKLLSVIGREPRDLNFLISLIRREFKIPNFALSQRPDDITLLQLFTELELAVRRQFQADGFIVTPAPTTPIKR